MNKNVFFTYTYETKIGLLRITADDKAVLRIELNRTVKPGGETETPLLHNAFIQLIEYLDGKRRRFDLPLAPAGTEFQRRVWKQLLNIPYGRTYSYRELASASGNRNACRAVGRANGANPIPIIIPCHRVIAADGQTGGYSGGLNIKKKLLDIEKSNISYFEYGKQEIDYLKSRDDKLAKIIEQKGMLHYEVIPDLYAALVNCITGQQISVKAADTIWQRLKEVLGEITPFSVNEAPDDLLVKTGLSKRKASNIKDAAQKIINGEIDPKKLKELPDNEICKQLTTLRGAGVWTAEMILIFSMERKNILSFNDYGIRRGICRLHGLESLNTETFENYRQLYTPFCTIASFYLWSIGNM